MHDHADTAASRAKEQPELRDDCRGCLTTDPLLAQWSKPATSITRWRDGRMIYVKVCMQRDEALSDLGVSEDELEPITP